MTGQPGYSSQEEAILIKPLANSPVVLALSSQLRGPAAFVPLLWEAECATTVITGSKC